MSADIDKERAGFEAAPELRGLDKARGFKDRYRNHDTSAAWRGWQARAAIPPSTGVAAERSKTMTSASNDAPCAFARNWKLDGDWMTCKGCKRNLIASRDGELLQHADGCKNWDQNHPWWQLRSILLGQAAPTTKEKP